MSRFNPDFQKLREQHEADSGNKDAGDKPQETQNHKSEDNKVSGVQKAVAVATAVVSGILFVVGINN